MSEFIRPFQDKYPTLGQQVYVDPKALVVGEVTLGDDVSVWPMAVIRGDVNSIDIGSSTNIQDGAVLHVTHAGPFTSTGRPLVLGQGITIGHQALLHACTIEDYCLVGMGARLLDGVHVEKRVMVGAASLVPPGKRLESGYLYLGSPARAVRKLTSQELEHLEYSAMHYVKLKNKYLEEVCNAWSSS
jgi:carbonic anhydrase/acetyltransferase-like protein (isoleucine patch superfamily)